MSIPVGIDELKERVASAGPVAYLVTVSESGAPHLVSVSTSWDGDALVAGAGNTTGKNVTRSPRVSLMWPTGVDVGYCLIVDGEASLAADGGSLSVVPDRAVLHRLAGATDGPSCITIV